MARVVCLGAALQNIYLLDKHGFDGDAEKISYQVGGSGISSAVSFARQGHETIFMGNIAKDVAGEAVLACLDDEAIDSSYVNFVRGNTGCLVSLIDTKTGQRNDFSYLGTATKTDSLNSDDLDLIQPDWLYVTTLYGDMDTLLAFFEKAHSIGCKIMFNPGVKELAESKKLIGLLEDTDVLILNKAEAAKVVSGTILTELVSRINNYVETVIITDSSMGGIASNRQETYRFGIYEDIKIKDLVGAGDAFGSGFLAHLIAGHSFRKSIHFAAANSSSVISKIGATTGILTGKESLHPMPIQEVKK